MPPLHRRRQGNKIKRRRRRRKFCSCNTQSMVYSQRLLPLSLCRSKFFYLLLYPTGCNIRTGQPLGMVPQRILCVCVCVPCRALGLIQSIKRRERKRRGRERRRRGRLAERTRAGAVNNNNSQRMKPLFLFGIAMMTGITRSLSTLGNRPLWLNVSGLKFSGIFPASSSGVVTSLTPMTAVPLLDVHGRNGCGTRHKKGRP